MIIVLFHPYEVAKLRNCSFSILVKISDESSWLVRILPLIHSMVQTQEMIPLNFRSFLLISVNLNKDYSFDAVPGNLSKIL